MAFAVQLYSVRDEFSKDLWGTLRKVRKMGYEGVEFYGDFKYTAKEVAAALDDTGLYCAGWHMGFQNLQPSALMSTISYNQVIGNSDIVVPSLPNEMIASKDACLKTAETFDEIAEKMAEYGMYLGFHNHADEFKEVEGDTPFHYIFDNTSRLVMQLDNGNALSAGPETDIYDLLIRYPYRVRTLHHKPYSNTDGFATMFGEDSIDWPRFLDLAAAHQNVEWHIVEYEDEKLYGNQFTGIEKSIQALSKMERDGDIIL